MSEKKVVEGANKYLLQEIKKRWPMIYKRRVEGCYVALLPNGFASHLQIICYAEGLGKYVLRLTDMYDPMASCSLRYYGNYTHYGIQPKKDAPYIYGSYKKEILNCFADCEVTFSLDEMERVIPWALDNYIDVKEFNPMMDWESYQEGSEKWSTKPLCYIRSKKTAEDLNIIYESRKMNNHNVCGGEKK